MLIIEKIKIIHIKIQSESGVNFSNHIQNLITLGVKGYTHSVRDGAIEYHIEDNFIFSLGKGSKITTINPTCDIEHFIEYLVRYQNGQIKFLNFCNHVAHFGIAKWIIDTIKMTCTYYDNEDNEILLERINKVL